MSVARLLAISLLFVAAPSSHADDRMDAAKAELQRLADQCKPVTEPATPEEEAQVRACPAKLAAEFGVEHKFVDTPAGTTG